MVAVLSNSMWTGSGWEKSWLPVKPPVKRKIRIKGVRDNGVWLWGDKRKVCKHDRKDNCRCYESIPHTHKKKKHLPYYKRNKRRKKLEKIRCIYTRYNASRYCVLRRHMTTHLLSLMMSRHLARSARSFWRVRFCTGGLFRMSFKWWRVGRSFWKIRGLFSWILQNECGHGIYPFRNKYTPVLGKTIAGVAFTVVQSKTLKKKLITCLFWHGWVHVDI